MFKNFIQKRLEKLAKKYLKKHQPTLVVVTGSVGKTSTKIAIATVLSGQYRVRVHKGNHNTHMSVPLGILGIDYPDNIRSLTEWHRVYKAAKLRIKQPKDTDVIVQELGTDTPGDIPHFGAYLNPDVAVVTAVSPEHMEFFKTIDAVAKEELSVASFSKLTVINRDDIASEFAQYAETTNIDTYGTSAAAEYKFEIIDYSKEGYSGTFISPEFGETPVDLKLASEHSVKAAVAAGLVATKLGMSSEQIKEGMKKIRPVAGRMNLLRGVEGATLIDDTYNSSPLAVEAALRTLYQMQAPQKIAILGSMNELGATSPQAHEQVGKMCSGAELAWVVTIGDEAEKYLAPAAKSQGCQVKSFKSPIDAGSFAHKVLEKNAIVLAKGSQNGVFAEEALKILLHSTEEEKELVRQEPHWLKIKQEQFAKIK
ncbi:UDP-N-acetylmuramoyl-tripeptide--D-alanyl-D-alanine ligase [Candidatus Saccharibacteria bacterium]|nr:UDP-N-acetylmuramoyl-tripeptide--D-alanyl-D-alanine ligase [Candidatus Saccharibacteria bacterium]